MQEELLYLPVKGSIISFASWGKDSTLPWASLLYSMLYFLKQWQFLFLASSGKESSLPYFFTGRKLLFRTSSGKESFSSWLLHEKKPLLRNSSCERSFSSLHPQARNLFFLAYSRKRASPPYFLRKVSLPYFLFFCTSSGKESFFSVIPQEKRASPPYFFKQEKFLSCFLKKDIFSSVFLTQRKFFSVLSLSRKASFSGFLK